MRKSLLILLFLLFTSVVQAQQIVNVTWTPNSESDLAGYRFYLINRINPLDVYRIGQVDCDHDDYVSSYTLNFNVPGGGRYLMVMTAFDQAENESERSNPALDRKNRRVVFFNKSAPKAPHIESFEIIKNEIIKED